MPIKCPHCSRNFIRKHNFDKHLESCKFTITKECDLTTDLEDRIHEIKKQEDKSLVLICDTGSQSANAGEVLNKSGFEKTVILSGGIGAWRLDNLPLV